MKFTKAELDAIGPRQRADALAWAHENVLVVDGPFIAGSEPTPFDSSRFPPQETIIRALDDPKWTDLTVVGPPQRSKTLSGAIIPILHRLFEKGQAVIYVHASADMAGNFFETKLLPSIKASKRLRNEIPKRRDDVGRANLRKFVNGTWLWLVGSESTGALSQLTAPVVICDDVQDMPPRVANRGHPCDLAMKRQGSFDEHQRTTVFLGTAGTTRDYHWQRLLQSAFYRPYLPCPHCEVYQLILWEQLRFPQDDPVQAMQITSLQCVNKDCGKEIAFADLPTMLTETKWASTQGMVTPPSTIDVKSFPIYPETHKPTTSCGFWFNALIWPRVSWGLLAADRIGATSDPDRMVSFEQNVLVQPTDPSQLGASGGINVAALTQRLNRSYSWGTIPMESGIAARQAVILVTADPGGGFVWYEVDVWNLKTGDSWIIEFGRIGDRPSGILEMNEGEAEEARKQGVIESLMKLRDKCAEGWQLAGGTGEVFKPSRVYVDRGYLPGEIDEACMVCGNRVWIPIVGSEKRAGRSPIWPGIDKYQRSVTSKGECHFWEINSNGAKLHLRQIWDIESGTGKRSLPYDTKSVMLDLMQRHLSAERWDDQNGVWLELNRQNHFLDLGSMQIAGAISSGVPIQRLGVRETKKEDSAVMRQEQQEQTRQVQQPMLPLIRRGTFRRKY